MIIRESYQANYPSGGGDVLGGGRAGSVTGDLYGGANGGSGTDLVPSDAVGNWLWRQGSTQLGVATASVDQFWHLRGGLPGRRHRAGGKPDHRREPDAAHRLPGDRRAGRRQRDGGGRAECRADPPTAPGGEWRFAARRGGWWWRWAAPAGYPRWDGTLTTMEDRRRQHRHTGGRHAQSAGQRGLRDQWRAIRPQRRGDRPARQHRAECGRRGTHRRDLFQLRGAKRARSAAGEPLHAGAGAERRHHADAGATAA